MKMEHVLNYLKRFQNVGTIIALVGAIGLVLKQFGIEVDAKWLNDTTTAICYVLIILGIANNPDTPGVDLPTTKIQNDKTK